MNGAIVFIIGLIAGTLGGFMACFVYDLRNEAVKRAEFDKFKKELDFALDDFNNNVITEISDIRNDLGKTFWLDDMTIHGINESLNEVTKKVDDHMRWSLGVWNDISVLIPDSSLHKAAKDLESYVHKKVAEIDDHTGPMGPITGGDDAEK